jgi:hypothetical protein
MQATFDVKVSVSQLGAKRTAPSEHDYMLLRHVIQYLVTTRNEPMVYVRAEKAHLTEAAGDASFNSEPRARSRFAQVHFFLGNLVHATSHSGTSRTPTSSNGAEVRVMCDTAKGGVHVRRIAVFLMERLHPSYVGLHDAFRVLTDSAGAYKTSQPFYAVSAMLRHIEPKYFYTRDLQMDGTIKVVQVKGGASDEQPADFLTKHFGVTHFVRKKRLLGIRVPVVVACE